MLARTAAQSFRPLAHVAPASVGAARVGTRAISVQSLLHGSQEAKKEGEVEILQHSRIIGRGKYVHGFEVHRVKPEATEEYKEAAAKYYTGLLDDPELHVKLSGSWETIVGEQDTFYHILEYENYAGFDKTTARIKDSEHEKVYKKMLPHLRSRTQQLCQEFLYFPTAPPHNEGGIFELRTYQLEAGRMLEWEATWRQGIEARRKFVEPVGAWFSQVGRLHQVHHMWQYPDLHTRKELREKAWQLGGWSDTVYKTTNLAKTMDSYILEALPYSTLR